MNIGLFSQEEPLKEVPQGMKQLFASYHLMTLDGKHSGFGNIVTYFYPEEYGGKLDKLVVELQKQITLLQEEKLGKKVIIQLLFFR